MDHEALLQSINDLGFRVNHIGEEPSGPGWNVVLHCRSQSSHIGIISDYGVGPTLYEALANASRNLQWRLANPPVPRSNFQKDLKDLLGLTKDLPPPRQFTAEENEALTL